MKTCFKACACAAALIAVAASAEPAAGRKVLARYEARLSERDHVSGKGKRLTTVAAVLQRDREHLLDAGQGKKGGFQDLEDMPDTYFVTKARLAEFEQAVARGHTDDATTRAILTATPVVRVTVYGDAGGGVAVGVDYVRGGKTVVEE